MSVTRPIPNEAMPVMMLLRQEVPRPKRLPGNPSIDTKRPSLRWKRGKFGHACPLGLLPNATDDEPENLGQFEPEPEFNIGEMVAFYEWWDEQSDPRAAVNAIWPRKVSR